jgi:hypothetical protein
MAAIFVIGCRNAIRERDVSDIINLNRVRKNKTKQAGKKAAERNRVVYGLPAAERKAALAAEEKAQQRWAENRLDRDNQKKKVDGDQ